MANWKKFLNGEKVGPEARKKSGLSSLIKREEKEGVKKKLEPGKKKELEPKKKELVEATRNKVKSTQTKSVNPNEKSDELQETLVSEKAMDYAWETYEGRMEILQRIYLVLRNHILWGEEDDKQEKYGAKNLLEFLGFDTENLVHIFMAVFGENPKLDQDFEIKNILGENVKNSDDFIFRKMLGCSEKTELKVAKEKIDKMADRLTLPELLSMNKKTIENIGLIYSEIKERELEGDDLTIGEKIKIAIENGIGKKQPIIHFDEEKVTQMIKDLHSDGRELDENPETKVQAPQAQIRQQITAGTQPVPQPSTQKPQVKPAVVLQSVNKPQIKPVSAPQTHTVNRPNQSNEQMETAVIQRLNNLLKQFQQSNEKAVELATKINETDVAQGNLLGFTFFKEKDKEGSIDIKKLIAEHFDMDDEKEINAKIMEIDTEFQKKNIYQ